MSLPGNNFYEMRVLDKELLSNSVIRLRMVPLQGKMAYQAGQFLIIELPDRGVRSYSMANAQANDGVVELHIRLHESGKFSELLRSEIRHGSQLRVQGPYGDCTWVEPVSRSSKILMLATGTGLAPMLALLEHALEIGCRNPIWLYWGGTTSDDLYFSDQLRNLEDSFEKFHYIPVLSKPEPEWIGEVGFVQQVAVRQHGNLASARVYACGAPIMVNSARELFTKTCYLPDQFFFADVFEPSDKAKHMIPSQLIEVFMRTANGQFTRLSLPEGDSLMAGLRKNGHIQGICGGRASCGTCRVNIHPTWVKQLDSASRTEKRLLATLEGSHPSDRLACQLVVTKDIMGLDFMVPDNPW